MAEIINLRQVRKRKAREEKENAAAANRLKFGTSKAERRLQDAQKTLDEKKLADALRSRPKPDATE